MVYQRVTSAKGLGILANILAGLALVGFPIWLNNLHGSIDELEDRISDIQTLALKISVIEGQILVGQLPRADLRISVLEDRLPRIENKLEAIERKLDRIIVPVPYPLDN